MTATRYFGEPPSAPPPDATTIAEGGMTLYESVDYCRGDVVARLRWRLLLSGVTAGEVARCLGVHASTVSHQLGGRDRLQPGTYEAIVHLTDERLASLSLARPFERRLLMETEGTVRPIIAYSSAGDIVDPFRFEPEFDRVQWFYLRKCVGFLTAGLVSVHDHAGPHVQTAMGDDLNVYTTGLHPTHRHYGFKQIRPSDWGVFICRPTQRYDLSIAELYLLPPSILCQLAGKSGDLFIPQDGCTLPRPSRWPGRDLRHYRIDLGILRSLAVRHPTAVVPDDCTETDDHRSGRWLGCQGPRWTHDEETCLLSLWNDPRCSLPGLALSFPSRPLRAVLQHARKMGLPPPPWAISGRQEWSKEEDEVLLLLAGDPDTDDRVLAMAFPSRSPGSVGGRLRRLRIVHRRPERDQSMAVEIQDGHGGPM